MIVRRRIAGWAAIASVTAIFFLLDQQQVLHSHFNWFVAILLALSVLLAGAIGGLARAERTTEPESSDNNERAGEEIS